MEIPSGLSNIGMIAASLEQQKMAAQAMTGTISSLAGTSEIPSDGNSDYLKAVIAYQTGKGGKFDTYA